MGFKKSFKNFINPHTITGEGLELKSRSDNRLFGVGVKLDPPLFIAILILSVLGLLNLAGIVGAESVFFKKQLTFFVIGIFILFLSPLIDYKIFKNYSLPSVIFFGVSIFLLLLTLQAAPVRGVTAWLHFPLGISFETSEIVKLAMILFLAKYFSSRINFNSIYAILISGIYTFLVIFLVFSQPDLGSAVILFLIWLSSVFLFGLTKRQILIAVIFLVIIFLTIGIFILQPYQQSRITSFLASWSSQGNESYNVLQAKIAIGSGGFWGLGFGSGSQAKFGILPEATSDFALAALIEQFGFVILATVLLLYLVILSRLFLITLRANDNFSKFFVFMFLIYFSSHIVINIGMNLGLLPVTGLPLPFISYGGSYFISLMIGFTILENIRSKSLNF